MTNRYAFVGVPCDIEALRKVEAFAKERNQEWVNDVAFQIGLFCRENWAYTCFRALIEDDFGVKLGDVEKFDIKKGNIIAYKKDGDKLEFPLGKSRPYVRIGCHVCLDFAAELADISIGAVGTPPKWSTVICRTKKGKEIFEGAVNEGYIEAKPIDEVKPGAMLVKKLTEGKRAENLEEAQKRGEKGIDVLHIKTLGQAELTEDDDGKNFDDLESDVIDAGLCIACGTCEAVCPEGCIKVIDQRPELQGECKDDCTDCYFLCPRTFLPQVALENLSFDEDASRETGVGRFLSIHAARAKDENTHEKGQDGGAVVAMLSYALDKGLIDGVISPKSGEDAWDPEPVLSKNSGELKKTSGTIYSHSVSIPFLKREATGK
jgi:coenzyme F420 hydrogenase subunit beta